MSILKYIVPIRPGVSSKEDSDVRQTSGSTGSRSAEVILHSSESSSEPISGGDEVVGLLEECGHDEANAPDSPSPTTSPVTCTRIVPLKPNQPRLKFPMRQFGSKRRSFCYSWYEKYRWLHYIEEEDAVLCFYCATAVQLKMPMRGYMDTVFSTSGFFNWKKALDKFSKHDQSACHCDAISMVAAASTEIMNVGTQLSAEYTEQKALNRKCLLAIMSNIRFLARQGLALRGAHYDADMTSDSIGGERESNFMQLLLLRKNEIPNLDAWLQKSRDRFTCPEIQNEFLQIMAHSVLRNIAAQLSGRYYSIMVDETTDVSNNEQLVFCVRYVDNKLISHEEFIGLHSMDCISAEHITRTIEDIMLRLSLPLQNCRGQCFDGASSMAGCRNGVSTKLLAKERRALYTHCYGHSLNLAVQDAVKANPNIRDALDTIEEMSKLIKKSPRRQVIFQKVKNDIALDSPGIRLLCPTRWTVKAEAFTSISENYEALMETWAEAKQINNDSEMSARIGGVAKQMESFDFFFGLELGRIVFSMSDNLSKALQGSSISASEGQSLMKMTLVAFQAIRSEDSFSVFWKTIERKRQLCKTVLIADPTLPRQRKVPKHLEIGSSAPEFANIVEDVYRKAYYEVIDFVVQSIKDRFDQNGYKMLSKLEELLCDSECKLEDYSDVMQLYGDDFNQQRMASQLLILHANLPHEIKSLVGGMKLKGIIAFLQSLSLIESELYTEVIKLAKLIIVMPATNAVSERTFSALRRLKTWLRSTMHQSRLNWCMLLHVHKDESDKLDLAIIGNEFASRNSSRQELFGIFP